MQEIIGQINKIAGVRGTAIVGDGGLIIAASVADNDDTSVLGAVVSGLYTNLSNALKKLQKGSLNRYVMSGSEGNAVIMAVSSQVLAVVLLRKDVNMGLVLVELKEFTKKLEEKLTL